MNKFTQHIPNWYEGGVADIFTFDKLDELLERQSVAWVKKLEGFKEFAIRMVLKEFQLVAVRTNNRWYPLGYLDIDIPELPRFVSNFDKRVMQARRDSGL